MLKPKNVPDARRLRQLKIISNVKLVQNTVGHIQKNNADKRNAYAKDYVEKRKAISSQKMYCNDCKIEVHKGSWPQHIKSKGHLWNTRKDCREFDDKQKWMTCPVCKNYPIQSQNYKRQDSITFREFKEDGKLNFIL